MSDAPIVLVLTHAGMQRFTDAQTDTDIDLTLAEVGLTNTAFTATPDLTALPGESRRLTTVTGDVVGDRTVHLTVTDDDAGAYSAKGLGLFLADGTLFAAYGQSDTLLTKVADLALMVAVDVVFPVSGVEAIDFGDLGFLNPPATSTTRGVVELATQAEANAGTPGPLVISAALWKTLSDALQGQVSVGPASETVRGTIELATQAEANAGTAGVLAITPPVLKTLLDAIRASVLPKATAAQVAVGTDDASAVTPAGFASLPKLLASIGYATLPGGLILQWGAVRSAIGDEIATTVAFPLTFPNACLARTVTAFISGPSDARDLWPQLAGEASTTGFTVQFQAEDDDNDDVQGFDWWALGY